MADELEQTENQGEQVSAWVNAPASSHVAGFKFFDRSGSEFGASSEIWVKFKGGGKNHRPASIYKYRFGVHDTAKGVWASLCGSDHPGAVVHSQLKEPRVPYQGPFYD